MWVHPSDLQGAELSKEQHDLIGKVGNFLMIINNLQFISYPVHLNYYALKLCGVV